MKQALTLILLYFTIFSVYGQKIQTLCPDSSEMVYVNQIHLSGNKITKDKIIYRELALKPGDSLCYKAFLQALK